MSSPSVPHLPTLLLLVFLAAPAAAQDTQDDLPISQSAAASQGNVATVTSDGCSAEFGTGPAAEPETKKPKPLSHVPNVGFLLFDGDKGQIYFRLFSYGRYLNQRNLDESYVDPLTTRCSTCGRESGTC